MSIENCTHNFFYESIVAIFNSIALNLFAEFNKNLAGSIPREIGLMTSLEVLVLGE